MSYLVLSTTLRLLLPRDESGIAGSAPDVDGRLGHHVGWLVDQWRAGSVGSIADWVWRRSVSFCDERLGAFACVCCMYISRYRALGNAVFAGNGCLGHACSAVCDHAPDGGWAESVDEGQVAAGRGVVSLLLRRLVELSQGLVELRQGVCPKFGVWGPAVFISEWFSRTVRRR